MAAPPTGPTAAAPTRTEDEVAAAAASLRALALDERLKALVATTPAYRSAFRRVARRYVSGPDRSDALARARAVTARGHRVTVDFMGESARSRAVAVEATEEFERLSADLSEVPGRTGLSLDASHVGSLVDTDLALAHLDRLATATAARGQGLVLSMEGEDRVDGILALHRELAREHGHVGVTLQARLDRTPADLDALPAGSPVRLVKGAYPADAGVERGDPDLARRYDELAARLIDSGRPCSIASHDPDRVDTAVARLRTSRSAGDVVVECLQGIGDDVLERLRERGVPTQEYVVYGQEDWLYVCNRIAEDPVTRLLRAVSDLGAR